MGPTRLRYTMLGFILGVFVVYLKRVAFVGGNSVRSTFYGAGIGLLLDGIMLRIKQQKGSKE